MNQFEPGDTDSQWRLLLAMLLATAVLLATPMVLQWLYPDAHKPPPPPVTSQTATPEEVPEVSASGPVEPEVVEEDPGEVSQGTARLVEIRNQDVIWTWNTRGGGLESARLFGFAGLDGDPLELIPQGLPEDVPAPFTIWSEDPEIDEELKQATFEVSGVSVEGEVLQAPAVVRLWYRSARLEVERVIRIPASGFILEMESRVRRRGRELRHFLVLGSGVGRSPAPSSGGFFSVRTGDFGFPGVAWFSSANREVERLSVEDAEGVLRFGEANWLAYDSLYFTYVILTDEAGIEAVRVAPRIWQQPGEEGQEPTETKLLTADALLGGDSNLLLFFGPKDPETLDQIDATLPQLIDYGWFSLLVRPLLFLLKVIYSTVMNYGWAIIILTFLINLALMPLRYKQIVSMKKMSVLQPKMKAIQERYKKMSRDDPKKQEMNREIMALYQKHGVNPLGGCLPLLIQMPFLYAFYSMLAYSVELRGAPFMLWVQDLSKPDPYYVTPIAMGFTMVVQQHFSPTTGDPSTRRVMMLMPIMFTFIFLSVSSGLALYFLFSNLFGMALQWAIQKWSAEEEEKPSSKPKRNPRKKARTR